MTFTITEKQTPQPEDVHARLGAVLGSTEVHFHPEPASKERLLEVLQEVITAEGALSIDLDDVESLLKGAQSIHVMDWSDNTKDLTQLTAEAVKMLQAKIKAGVHQDILLALQSKTELEIATLSDCMGIVDPLGNDDSIILTGDMSTEKSNRVLLVAACK